MSRIKSIPIRRDETLELVLRGQRARGVARPPGARASTDQRWFPSKIEGNCAVRLFDSGVALDEVPRSAEPNDLANSIRQMSMETRVNPDSNQLVRLRELLIANVDAPAPRYLYSNRQALSNAWQLPATLEMDGYLLGLDFRSVSTPDHIDIRTKHVEVLHGAFYARQQRTATQMEADLAALEPFIGDDSRQEFQARKAEVAALEQEKVIGSGGARLQKDLSLAIQLSNGQWQIGVTSPYIHHAFNQWDSTQYKVTAQAYFEAEPIDYRLFVGLRQSADVRVYLVPVRYRYTTRWWALYLFTVIFAAPVLTFRPSVAVYEDRLPLDFTFTELGTDMALNDVAVSYQIGLTNRYALQLAQDAALAYQTPLSALTLAGRVDGEWSVRFTNIQQGELLGFLDFWRSGHRDRCYVWRTTPKIHAGELVGYGALSTSEVTPHPRFTADYSITPLPFGPI